MARSRYCGAAAGRPTGDAVLGPHRPARRVDARQGAPRRARPRLALHPRAPRCRRPAIGSSPRSTARWWCSDVAGEVVASHLVLRRGARWPRCPGDAVWSGATAAARRWSPSMAPSGDRPPARWLSVAASADGREFITGARRDGRCCAGASTACARPRRRVERRPRHGSRTTPGRQHVLRNAGGLSREALGRRRAGSAATTTTPPPSGVLDGGRYGLATAHCRTARLRDAADTGTVFCASTARRNGDARNPATALAECPGGPLTPAPWFARRAVLATRPC